MSVWSSVNLSKLSGDFRLDAEHYQPKHLRQEAAMAGLNCVPLGEVAHVSDGNHLSIAEQFVDDGVRYLRGQDLSNFFISDADPIYIPETTYDLLGRSHMHPGDVLVGIVGTIGSVGIVTERHGKLTGNCKLAIIRSSSVPAEYIAAYLSSRVGQNEIARSIRGAVQMGVILPDIKKLPVVIAPEADVQNVVNAVKSAQAKREKCASLIAEAADLITHSLGMAHFDFSETLFYERRLSDLKTANRFGAEYFMPAKQQALNILADKPGAPISASYQSVRKVFDPASVSKSMLVRNFDVTDALGPVLDDRKEPERAGEIGSIKKVFNADDVVISRLRWYLREIALVRTSSAITAVGSSEFIVLRCCDGRERRVSPETLLVYLRSKPVQTILRWSQDGSQHPRFTEADLLAIPVPNVLRDVSVSVDKLVHSAFVALGESAIDLSAAKTIFEKLVASEERLISTFPPGLA
jgi:type I restriction enzyme, S subunit